MMQLLLNGIIAGSMYALIAAGFAVIYRTVRFFHLSHGAVYAAGAYFAFALVAYLGADLVASFAAATLLAGIAGLAIDRLVYRPLRMRKSRELAFLVASFAVLTFVQSLLQLSFGSQVMTIRTGPVKQGYNAFGGVITDTQMLMLIVSLCLLVALWLFAQKTKLGKAMRAVSDDPIAAGAVGIHAEKIIAASFFIGSALAGAAGVLVSFETNIEPSMGLAAVLKGITASVLGGFSMPGAVLGGYLLGIVENLGIAAVQSVWKDTIAFAILIAFLLLRPGCIFLGKQVI
jgi:branched-chain amino acid transport system permease protein